MYVCMCVCVYQHFSSNESIEMHFNLPHPSVLPHSICISNFPSHTKYRMHRSALHIVSCIARHSVRFPCRKSQTNQIAMHESTLQTFNTIVARRKAMWPDVQKCYFAYLSVWLCVIRMLSTSTSSVGVMVDGCYHTSTFNWSFECRAHELT